MTFEFNNRLRQYEFQSDAVWLDANGGHSQIQ